MYFTLNVIMVKIIDTVERELRELLSYELQYTVPIYQREYVWSDEHIEDFLNDLFRHMANMSQKYYFFGTFYLIKDSNDSDKRLIVDGQQRLTTIIIFLTVIRDILVELNRHESAKIITDYIQIDIDSHNTYRLTLNDRNRSFFEKSILPIGKPDNKIQSFMQQNTTNENLAVAYKTINTYLSNKIKCHSRDSGEYLMKIHTHLLKYFVVLENVVESQKVVQEIFDTVNRRGIGLSEGDFVKNQILEIAEKNNNDAHMLNERWIELLDILNSVKMNESYFLRHYLMAYYERVDIKSVAKKIIEIVSNNNNLDIFVDHLFQVGSTYVGLKNLDDNQSGSVVNDLNGLNALNSHVVYPALLIGHDKLKDSKQFAKLVNIMLIFFFRSRTIGRVEANNIEIEISNICEMLRNPGTRIINDIQKYLRNSQSYTPDLEFKSKFSVHTAKGKSAAYILNQLNKQLSGEKELTGKVTVEHIMPKKIEDTDWEVYFKNDLHKTNREARRIYHSNNLNKIGNLTLLSQPRNSSAQNQSFTKKFNSIYKNDNIYITTMLKKYTEWNEDTILDRQQIFSDAALKIWNLN